MRFVFVMSVFVLIMTEITGVQAAHANETRMMCLPWTQRVFLCSPLRCCWQTGCVRVRVCVSPPILFINMFRQHTQTHTEMRESHSAVDLTSTAARWPFFLFSISRGLMCNEKEVKKIKRRVHSFDQHASLICFTMATQQARFISSLVHVTSRDLGISSDQLWVVLAWCETERRSGSGSISSSNSPAARWRESSSEDESLSEQLLDLCCMWRLWAWAKTWGMTAAAPLHLSLQVRGQASARLCRFAGEGRPW